MNIIKTPLNGLLIIEPTLFRDQRGYFYESYNQSALQKQGIDIQFVQDNQSRSVFGVIRGLHFQKEPKAQTKLVRVLSGVIFDVALDIRNGSPTFGRWFGLELSGDNNKQLLIPKGFAHGFSVLSETAVVLYKCDEFYASDHDAGIVYSDPELGIDWKIPLGKEIVSGKDAKLPLLKNAIHNFVYTA